MKQQVYEEALKAIDNRIRSIDLQPNQDGGSQYANGFAYAKAVADIAKIAREALGK